MAASINALVPLLRQVVILLPPSLLHPCLTKCSSTETIPDAKQMDFTLIMLSLMLQDRITGLVPLGVLKTEEESSRLSSLKPPMKQLVDGQVRQMVHMHGDIALLENKTSQIGTVIPLIGHVPKATLAEDLSNYLTTTTMGCLEGQLIGT